MSVREERFKNFTVVVCHSLRKGKSGRNEREAAKGMSTRRVRPGATVLSHWHLGLFAG